MTEAQGDTIISALHAIQASLEATGPLPSTAALLLFFAMVQAVELVLLVAYSIFRTWRTGASVTRPLVLACAVLGACGTASAVDEGKGTRNPPEEPCAEKLTTAAGATYQDGVQVLSYTRSNLLTEVQLRWEARLTPSSGPPRRVMIRYIFRGDCSPSSHVTYNYAWIQELDAADQNEYLPWVYAPGRSLEAQLAAVAAHIESGGALVFGSVDYSSSREQIARLLWCILFATKNTMQGGSIGFAWLDLQCSNPTDFAGCTSPSGNPIPCCKSSYQNGGGDPPPPDPCADDRDGDDIPDCSDPCPDDYNNACAECTDDTDMDGTPDCEDDDDDGDGCLDQCDPTPRSAEGTNCTCDCSNEAQRGQPIDVLRSTYGDCDYDGDGCRNFLDPEPTNAAVGCDPNAPDFVWPEYAGCDCYNTKVSVLQEMLTDMGLSLGMWQSQGIPPPFPIPMPMSWRLSDPLGTYYLDTSFGCADNPTLDALRIGLRTTILGFVVASAFNTMLSILFFRGPK